MEIQKCKSEFISSQKALAYDLPGPAGRPQPRKALSWLALLPTQVSATVTDRVGVWRGYRRPHSSYLIMVLVYTFNTLFKYFF